MFTFLIQVQLHNYDEGYRNLNNALKEANYDDYYKGIDLARGTYITSKRDRTSCDDIHREVIRICARVLNDIDSVTVVVAKIESIIAKTQKIDFNFPSVD